MKMQQTYLENYLNQLKPLDLVNSVQKTVDGFMQKLNVVPQKEVKNVLLLGNVQSGKTAQVLGILSALADEQCKIFLYLTTDSIDLQQQTVERAKNSLEKFIVLSETDDNCFTQVMKADNPIIVVLKKNAHVLKRWRNLFASQTSLKGYPLVIVDDEADAASLNTNSDKKDKDPSTINQLLNDIKNACCQSLFIQLTATPQSLLLQNEDSNWQPEFVHYFEAGEQYIGGRFVFSDPPNELITRFIDSELDEIQDESAELANGVNQALQSFLLTCAEFSLCNKENCNFAIHPSIRIYDHEAFKDKIQARLNDWVQALNYGENLMPIFQDKYNDLKQTRPEMHHFEDVYAKLCNLLENQQINIVVLNSKTENKFNLTQGFNIIVGGNVIGRGLTIPKLQTVYYSRMAKKPNADTFWQHSRIFGYDRDKSLLRLYIPVDTYRFFVTLNEANNLLIEQVCKDQNHKIQMIYPKNINPTRKNVLVSESLNMITGGVNYFPNEPDEENNTKIQEYINIIRQNNKEIERGLYQIDTEYMLSILSDLGTFQETDWNKDKFISSIRALQYQRPSFKSYILIREERKLTKGTGTMLSPDDRRIGERYPNDLVLTLYQVTGEQKNGWKGQLFWLPNIKLPHKGVVYWSL